MSNNNKVEVIPKKGFFEDLFIKGEELIVTKTSGEVKGYNKSIEMRLNIQTGSTSVDTSSYYDGNSHNVSTHVYTSPTLVSGDNIPVIDFFLQTDRGELDVTLYKDVRMRDGHHVTLVFITHNHLQFLTKIVNNDTRKQYTLVDYATIKHIAETYTNFKKIGIMSVILPAIALLSGSIIGAIVLFGATFFVIKKVILEKNMVAIRHKIEDS